MRQTSQRSFDYFWELYYRALCVFCGVLGLFASFGQAQPRPQVFQLHSAESGNVAGTVISTFGYPSVTVDNSIAAAWDGTLNYEANYPSIGFVAVQCVNQATNLVVTTTTGAASVRCNITGAQQFRARVSGRTVGTVTATAAILSGGESGLASVSITDTLVDNAPFTDGTSRVFPVGYIFDEVAGIALTENDVAAGRIDSKRAQVFVIEDATTRGTRAAVTAAGLAVDTELPAAAALADAASATPTTPTIGVVPLVMNATTLDRARAVVNTLNSTGTGITAAGIVGQFDDVAPTAITENQFGPVRISSNRNIYSTIRDAAGNERGLNVDANGEIGIGAIRTSVTPGTAAANLGKAEDAPHTSGDVGVMALVVRNDVRGTLAGTDLDYAPLQLNSSGDLRTDIASLGGNATTTGSGVVGTGTLRVTQATDVRVGVDPISGQIGIAGGTGVDGATVPRVTLATNIALPTGDNKIGRTSITNSGNTAQAAVQDGNSDGITAAQIGLYTVGIPILYNGVSYDRQRSGSATSTQPHYGAGLVQRAGGTFTFLASTTHAATTTIAAQTGLGGFNTLVVTWNVTAAERDSADETYDLYVTCGDGVSAWDVIHFPQIITTGAKRYTAVVKGDILPQEVTTATPGVAANASGTLKTDTVGANEGTRTLGAGKVRHGMLGDRCGADIVIAGTIATGITHSITMTVKP